MPYTTYYGPNTMVAEKCLWIVDGNRRICISYEYKCGTGELRYAATVFRCKVSELGTEIGTVCEEPTEQQMFDNAHTTERRFAIRPVIVVVEEFLRYDDIIKAIRREMCHGFGCKGPRSRTQPSIGYEGSSFDDGSTSSENSFLSELDEDPDYKVEEDVDVDSLEGKKIRQVRYISTTNTENYNGNKIPIIREYFIAFKASKRTGDLIYGAAISRRREDEGPMEDAQMIAEHYKTAIARLNKKPVPMRVDAEYRYQLGKNSTHREDIMYEILDVINSRPGGRFLIKGGW